MTPKTLRRKLQKKRKHKPYRKCLKCGNRCTLVLKHDQCHSFCMPRLFVTCGRRIGTYVECNGIGRTIAKSGNGEFSGCGYIRELFYGSSGGTVDAYPT